MKIEIRPGLYLTDGTGKPRSLAQGMQLLIGVEKEGNLQAVSHRLSISYRHAWNILADLEKLFGADLVDMARGRGSKLTPLGIRLVSAHALLHARMNPLLDNMASEIEAELQAAMASERDVLNIYASHGFAIEALNKHAKSKGIDLDLNYRGSIEALDAFSRNSCDIAGFHVPTGPLQPLVLKIFKNYLDPDWQIVHLATRRQGIMVAKGNPKKVWNISDLANPDVRFVNRQQGSGTRMMLDLLLAEAGRSGSEIKGYADIELTHAAIAAYVRCGKADAGVGVEPAAREFDLDFIPLLNERYFLVCKGDMISDPRFVAIINLLRTSEFHAEVNNFRGYDATNAGNVARLADVFPELYNE